MIRSGLTCDALEECVMLLGRVRAIDCVLRAVKECTGEKETDRAGGESEWKGGTRMERTLPRVACLGPGCPRA